MPQDINKTLIDGILLSEHDINHSRVDLGSFIENILLFDTFILKSNGLSEIPHLLTLFGLGGFRDLLKSGSLRFHCDLLTVAQIGQSNIELRAKNGLLPLGSYSFAMVTSGDAKKDMSRHLQVVDNVPGLVKREKQKLKLLLVEHQVRYPHSAADDVLNQLKADLRNNSPSLVRSVQKCIYSRLSRYIDPSTLKLSIDEVRDGDFRTENNVADICNVDERTAHEIVERALLGVGGSNQKGVDMKSFNGITSFREDEVSVFDERLSFIRSQVDPSVPRSQFNRVLEITGLPSTDSILATGSIDVDMLLRFKDSSECRDFREWLWTIDSTSNQHLQSELNGFRQRIAEILRTPTGKLVRWGMGIGLSLIPDWGMSIAAAEGAIDMFLLDRLLPVHGPIYFVNRMLPSIYRKP